MKKLYIGEPPFIAWLKKLRERSKWIEVDVEPIVREIIKEMKIKGDSALLEYTFRFDGISYNSIEEVVVDKREMEDALQRIDGLLLEALVESAKRIRIFHEHELEDSWFISDDTGSILGKKVTPLERVGAYVPGGRALYPSSLLMNVIPAKVAGVREVVVCTPSPSGKMSDVLLAAASIAGVDKIFKVGGVQAIAAMAYGTDTIPQVDKIVGPGNIYVSTAKRLVFGEVDIDSIAGPSEIVILSDESSDPGWVASDLLSQAEHDPMALAVLVTNSEDLSNEVIDEIEHQLEALSTKETACKSLETYGAIVICSTLEEGMELVNQLAPEHLELLTRDPWNLLPMVNNAGAIFLGSYSAEPLGDYIAGPNHVLPTGGKAKFSSPLGTKDFIKYSSILYISPKTFDSLCDEVIRLAYTEGLPAHAKAIEIRKNSRFKEK